MEFKVGDIVQINSGGPKMTLTGFDEMFIDADEQPLIFCKWWDENSNSFKKDRFSSKTIKKVE